MLEADRAALAVYRLQKAEDDLSAAKQNCAFRFFDAAANRSYYAIFHATRALLALNDQDYKKHSGVIANFRKDYIKTGILDKRLSDIIQNAFEIRTDCDYEDFFVVSKEDVQSQIEDAEFFICEIKKYLTERLEDKTE